MTPEHFSYWLQGFFELTGSNTLTEEQVKIIKDHIQLVFHKATPNYQYSGIGSPVDQQGLSGMSGTDSPIAITCSADPKVYVGDPTHYPYQPESYGSRVQYYQTPGVASGGHNVITVTGFLSNKPII